MLEKKEQDRQFIVLELARCCFRLQCNRDNKTVSLY